MRHSLSMKREIAIDAVLRIARMNDEQSHQAERHLRHLVVMRVIHVRAVLPEREFVFECLARFDHRLRQPADAVHSVRQNDSVPVNARRRGQFVRHVNADAIAFDRFDCRSVHPTIEAPAKRLQSGSELVFHFLSDEMIDLHAIDDLPRQRNVVRRDYRRVIATGLRRRRSRGWRNCLSDRGRKPAQE